MVHRRKRRADPADSRLKLCPMRRLPRVTARIFPPSFRILKQKPFNRRQDNGRPLYLYCRINSGPQSNPRKKQRGLFKEYHMGGAWLSRVPPVHGLGQPECARQRRGVRGIHSHYVTALSSGRVLLRFLSFSGTLGQRGRRVTGKWALYKGRKRS
jgi:hypothetical protein